MFFCFVSLSFSEILWRCRWLCVNKMTFHIDLKWRFSKQNFIQWTTKTARHIVPHARIRLRVHDILKRANRRCGFCYCCCCCCFWCSAAYVIVTHIRSVVLGMITWPFSPHSMLSVCESCCCSPHNDATHTHTCGGVHIAHIHNTSLAQHNSQPPIKKNQMDKTNDEPKS